ncbi:MAG: peptidylprolyl isomerase [Candidatus Omnitrophota bacterium]
MKYFRTLIALHLFLACQGLLFAPGSRAEVVERILAVVNDEIITEQDLQLMMAPVLAQYRAMFTGPELEEKILGARREFLNRVIEDRLILSEAKRRLVIVKDIEVDEMMADVRNKFPSRELFLNSLEEQGLSEKKLWNRFRDQIMTQKLTNFEVKSRISVSPGEVNAYYKAYPDEFAQGDRVKLQHILIRVGARTEEEAHEFAESLVSQLRAGKPFEELARTYSEGAEAKEGGEMGWVEKGQLLGEIDEKIFALQEGEVTAPIKSSLGYHLFKVTEKQKFSVKPITEVRGQIQDRIFKTKLRQRLEAWIENLKKNAYISIR